MPNVILRSLFARVGTVLIALVCLYVVGIIWLSDGYGNGLQALSVAVLIVVGLWLLWWRPQADLRDDALYVRNAWHTHRVSWDVVETARTRWELVLETSDADGNQKNVTIAAAQRGGAFSTAWRQRHQPSTNEAYLIPSARTFRTHLPSDDAAQLIDLYKETRDEQHKYAARQEKRARRMEKHGGEAVSVAQDSAASVSGEEHTGVETSVNWSSAIVLVLAVLAVVASTVLL